MGAILATVEVIYVAVLEERKRELKECYGFRLVDAEDAS